MDFQGSQTTILIDVLQSQTCLQEEEAAQPEREQANTRKQSVEVSNILSRSQSHPVLTCRGRPQFQQEPTTVGCGWRRAQHVGRAVGAG